MGFSDSGALSGGLLLVGAGKMGGALLDGWLKNGLDANQVQVQDPAPPPEMVALLKDRGIASHAVCPIGEPPQVMVLAVKPQIMDQVLPGLAGHVGPQTLVLSVAAGKTIGNILRYLPSDTAIVRTIPNTPASVGRGMTVAVANDAVSDGQRKVCDDLLATVGLVGWVADEALIDAATAVSGSGPAYVFYMVECLAHAGEMAGLPQDLARLIARQTIVGAGELLAQSPLDASTLRENVTSPGGTTAAALEVLMGNEGLDQLMTVAIAAATKRSVELSG